MSEKIWRPNPPVLPRANDIIAIEIYRGSRLFDSRADQKPSQGLIVVATLY